MHHCLRELSFDGDLGTSALCPLMIFILFSSIFGVLIVKRIVRIPIMTTLEYSFSRLSRTASDFRYLLSSLQVVTFPVCEISS